MDILNRVRAQISERVSPFREQISGKMNPLKQIFEDDRLSTVSDHSFKSVKSAFSQKSDKSDGQNSLLDYSQDVTDWTTEEVDAYMAKRRMKLRSMSNTTHFDNTVLPNPGASTDVDEQELDRSLKRAMEKLNSTLPTQTDKSAKDYRNLSQEELDAALLHIDPPKSQHTTASDQETQFRSMSTTKVRPHGVTLNDIATVFGEDDPGDNHELIDLDSDANRIVTPQRNSTTQGNATNVRFSLSGVKHPAQQIADHQDSTISVERWSTRLQADLDQTTKEAFDKFGLNGEDLDANDVNRDQTKRRYVAQKGALTRFVNQFYKSMSKSSATELNAQIEKLEETGQKVRDRFDEYIQWEQNQLDKEYYQEDVEDQIAQLAKVVTKLRSEEERKLLEGLKRRNQIAAEKEAQKRKPPQTEDVEELDPEIAKYFDPNRKKSTQPDFTVPPPSFEPIHEEEAFSNTTLPARGKQGQRGQNRGRGQNQGRRGQRDNLQQVGHQEGQQMQADIHQQAEDRRQGNENLNESTSLKDAIAVLYSRADHEGWNDVKVAKELQKLMRDQANTRPLNKHPIFKNSKKDNVASSMTSTPMSQGQPQVLPPTHVQPPQQVRPEVQALPQTQFRQNNRNVENRRDTSPDRNRAPSQRSTRDGQREPSPSGWDTEDRRHSRNPNRNPSRDRSPSTRRDRSISNKRESYVKPYLKMDLPKFDNNPRGDDWVMFKAKFMSLCGEMDIAPRRKLCYLLNYLDGEPRDFAVQATGHEISDAAYAKVLHILDNHYGGNIRVKRYYFNELRDHPPLREFDQKEVHRFYLLLDDVLIHQQNSSPEAIYEEGSHICEQAKSLIPQTELKTYYLKLAEVSGRDNFKNFHKWIKTQYEAFKLSQDCQVRKGKSKPHAAHACQEAQEDSESPDSYKEPTYATTDKPKGFGATTSSQTTRQSLDNKPPAQKIDDGKPRTPHPPCPKCKEAHPLWKCTLFRMLNESARFLFIKNNRICFHCLKDDKHKARDCKFQEGEKCGVNGCTRYHHKLLHVEKEQGLLSIERFLELEKNSEYVDEDYPESKVRVNHAATMFSDKGHYTAIRTATVIIRVGDKKKRVVAALDACSSCTNVDAELARELGMPITRARVKREVCFLERQVSMTSDIVSFSISPLNSNKTFQVQGYTVKDLVKGTPVVNWKRESEKYSYLKDTELPEPDERDQVLVLIGTDFAKLMASTQAVYGNDNEPIAEKTQLGWAYSGKIRNCQVSSEEGQRAAASHIMRDLCLTNWAEPNTCFTKLPGARTVEIGSVHTVTQLKDVSKLNICQERESVKSQFSLESIDCKPTKSKHRRRQRKMRPRKTDKPQAAGKYISTNSNLKMEEEINTELKEANEHSSPESEPVHLTRRQRQRLKRKVRKDQLPLHSTSNLPYLI